MMIVRVVYHALGVVEAVVAAARWVRERLRPREKLDVTEPIPLERRANRQRLPKPPHVPRI